MGQSTHQGADQYHNGQIGIGPKDKLISIGWHWNYGFLRRPEMDNRDGFTGYCYESPDADMIYTERGDHDKICFFNEWLDAETHEKYLTLDPRPTDFLVAEYGSRRYPGRVKL